MEIIFFHSSGWENRLVLRRTEDTFGTATVPRQAELQCMRSDFLLHSLLALQGLLLSPKYPPPTCSQWTQADPCAHRSRCWLIFPLFHSDVNFFQVGIRNIDSWHFINPTIMTNFLSFLLKWDKRFRLAKCNSILSLSTYIYIHTHV